MALVKGIQVPVGLREAQFLVESGCAPTLEELDNMPVDLVERMMMYRGIKAVKLSGD